MSKMGSMALKDVLALASVHTLHEACAIVGVGSTQFKKFLRDNGLKPWPHRMIKSLREMLCSEDGTTADEKRDIEDFLRSFVEEPKPIPDWIKTIRGRVYRKMYKNKRNKRTRSRDPKCEEVDLLFMDSPPPHVCDVVDEFSINLSQSSRS